MPLARLTVFFAVLGLSMVPTYSFAAEVDETRVRQAWTKQLDQHAGVAYKATGVELVFRAGPKGRIAHRAKLKIRVLMRCDKRKFRFDIGGRKDGESTRHILDGRKLHTSVQTSAGKWTVSSGRLLKPDSDILYLYPFLLARGAVPIPPYEAFRAPAAGRRSKKDVFDLAGHAATFATGGTPPISTRVSHDPNGLVLHYDVTRNGKKALVVRNTYSRVKDTISGRVKDTMRLERFSVILFRADGSAIGRLDGRVTEYRVNAVIPIEAFTLPSPPKEQRRKLLEAIRGTATLEATMSLDELSNIIQAAVGPKTRVRIDREAFEKHPSVRVDQLMFEPGEVKLSQLLFDELRDHHLDFYVDPQGIVLLPRSEAWTYAEVTDYAARDYGIGLAELRDRLYETATTEDWSDVGGQAHLTVDTDRESVSVLHTQSDHLRFETRLTGKQ